MLGTGNLKERVLDRLSEARGTGRVLASDQTASKSRGDVGLEWSLRLLELSSHLDKLGLHKDRANVSQSSPILLLVAESGNGGISDKVLAVGELDVLEDNGAVADSGDNLAILVDVPN